MLRWTASNGRGVVRTFTVVHQPFQSSRKVPYTVAVIELEEGAHLLSTVVEDGVELAVGLPGDITFVSGSHGLVPCFRPRSGVTR